MAVYLKEFSTQSEYEQYINGSGVILPNVSYCEDNDGVHYNPIQPETKLVVYYDIQNISSPTTVCTNYSNSFKSMEIDDADSIDITTQGNIQYQFSGVGEHIIKYELADSSVGSNSPLFNNILIPMRVIIPNTFTRIGDYAFQTCGLISIVIPDSVTTIGNNAFTQCSGLTSIDIPDSVTTIGDSAFASCKFTSIAIPDSVTTIGNRVLYNCNNLTSIDIPNSVTSIGDEAFYRCISLTNITCNAMTAPVVSNTTFQDVKTSGTLTVPSGSSGYDVWMGTSDYYLGKYNWTKVEQ